MMTMLMLVFVLILTSVISIGICFFLADRLTLYFSLPSRKILFGVFLWLFIFLCWGAFGLVHTKNTLATSMHWVTCIGLGFYLYLVICILVIEPLRKVLKFKNKVAGITTLASAAFITVYGVYNAYQLVVTERTIEIANLTQPIKAVHVTDTHIGQFRSKKDLQKLVDVINKINPDVVFHTGDLLDSRVHLGDDVLAPLANIKVPIFFVQGNHDTDTGLIEIGRDLRKLRVYYLQNQIKQWNGIQIVGLNYMYADEESLSLHIKHKKSTVKTVLSKMELDQSKPIILLHHGPYGTKYAQKAGVNLYLSGHTHGGQIFPFNFLNDYIFEFNAGLYDLKGMKVNIPFGVGTYGPPMRVGTKSEMTLLHLVPKK